MSFRGVYNILSTPFQPAGDLDLASLRRLVEAVVAAGVDGVTVLGVAGEAQKLTEPERRQVTETVMEAAGGRVPVVAGVSQDGTEACIAAATAARRAGAAGLMVAPPTFLQPGPQLTRHLQRVGDAAGLPIVLQDYPPVNGVTMSPRDMAALAEAVPAITTIKLEGVPTPLRTAQTLSLTGERVTVLGGLGGVYLLDELRRGASGTMTGFAYPELLVEVWRAWTAGDRSRATDVFYRFLPLMVFEGQPGIGLAVRKETQRLRGLVDHATVREPGPSLDEGIRQDLEETIARLGIRAAYDRPAVPG